MAPRLGSGDASGFKFLLFLVAIYGLIVVLVHSILHMRFITPLEIDTPLDRFSEARAIEHVRVLAKDIDSRQEGSPGLREAARYITLHLEMVKERAGPNYRVEIEEIVVNGSFNMLFMKVVMKIGGTLIQRGKHEQSRKA